MATQRVLLYCYTTRKGEVMICADGMGAGCRRWSRLPIHVATANQRWWLKKVVPSPPEKRVGFTAREENRRKTPPPHNSGVPVSSSRDATTTTITPTTATTRTTTPTPSPRGTASFLRAVLPPTPRISTWPGARASCVAGSGLDESQDRQRGRPSSLSERSQSLFRRHCRRSGLRDTQGRELLAGALGPPGGCFGLLSILGVSSTSCCEARLRKTGVVVHPHRCSPLASLMYCVSPSFLRCWTHSKDGEMSKRRGRSSP